MSKIELLPCPFCGGKAKINARQSGFHGQNFEGNKKLSWTIYIKCNKCHSRGKPIKTEPIELLGKKAICKWGIFMQQNFGWEVAEGQCTQHGHLSRMWKRRLKHGTGGQND